MCEPLAPMRRVRSSIVARVWAPEEETLLVQLLSEGKDLSAIAAHLNRTIASVQRRASDLRAQSQPTRTTKFTFADYLVQRRSTYTQERELLQQLKQDTAFREARSWEYLDRYLNERAASHGLRDAARSAWIMYQQAKRKRHLGKR